MDRESLCYHEAGHAVMALHVEALVDDVSVVANHDSEGRVIMHYRKRSSALNAVQEAMVHAAGPAADGLFSSGGDTMLTRRHLLDCLAERNDPDFSGFRGAVRVIYSKRRTPDDSQARLSGMIADQTIAVLRRKWRAVEAIASGLARLGRLSGETVAMVYQAVAANEREEQRR